MAPIYIGRKGFVLFSLLFFCSCSKPQTWSYSELESSAGFMRPARIQALSSVPYVQLEFTQAQDPTTLTGHINFLYHELAPSEGSHPDLIELNISNANTTKVFLCTRLKGGGRLLLSKAATDFLLKTLTESEPVSLSIEGNEICVHTDGFEDGLNRLKQAKKTDWSPSFGLDWN